ncbi:MAG: alcohol dehydrogenase catalytic domain-containing protein [Anaerolineae bacterium]|nr:alcohol dehydrogenase catalytic domain-containing protein [Anaerolineae bacterium]
MRAMVFRGIGEVQAASLPTPVPAAGEALLRVHSVGLCMTDMHIMMGHFAVKPPRVLGHELAGVVTAVGAGVDPAWIGQLAGVSPARFCGHCLPCRNGSPHLCANFECLGNTHDGGLAEFTLVRGEQLVALPNGMTAERAVWMEPLACVLHALETAVALPRIKGNDGRTRVLVSGAGTLGRLLIQALRFSASNDDDSAVSVAVVDPNADKVRIALAAGAEAGWIVPRSGSADETAAQIRAWADGSLMAVIETSGKAIAVERSLDWATPRTRIVLFGVSDPQDRAAISPSSILAKELSITAAAGMTPATFDAAARLLNDDRLDTASLVEQVINLEQVPDALTRMSQRSTGKILVRL